MGSNKMILSAPFVIASMIPILMFMVGSFIFTSVRSSLLSLSGDESNPQRISSSNQYVYQNGHYYQHYGQLVQYGQSISTVGQNKFYQDKEEHLDSSSTQDLKLLSGT